MKNPLSRLTRGTAAWDLGSTARRDIWSDSGLDRIPPPQDRGNQKARSGERVSPDTTLGLTAALAAVRLLSETVGQLDCTVVKEDEDGRIFAPAPTHPMYPILHRRANTLQAGQFFFWAHIMASL